MGVIAHAVVVGEDVGGFTGSAGSVSGDAGGAGVSAGEAVTCSQVGPRVA